MLTAKCQSLMANYVHARASAGDMVEYANCVGETYALNVQWELVFAALIAGMAIGAWGKGK